MSRTSVKITIGVAIITLSLLLFVDIVAVSLTGRAFDRFLSGQEQYGFILLPSPREIRQQASLQEEFKNNLYFAITLASAISFVASIAFGFLIGSFITRPLRNLKYGIKKLEQNEYKYKIENTGDEEIDEVINEFNSLSKKLEHVENLRKDLVSDISHELKTPLTALKGQIEGIKDGVFKPDKERISIIEDQVNRLNDLINELQGYTRLRSNLSKIKKEEIDILKLTNRLLKPYDSKLKNENISVSVDIEKNQKIMADSKMLERIMSNIIDNSIKYSKADKILIKFENNKLFLSDNGVGIDEVHRQYIFERFYRVEKSRNRSTGGLGLGLAIVKDLVEAHGWKISVEDSLFEKGVSFVIEILH